MKTATTNARRVCHATVFEQGKERRIIATLNPRGVVELRAEGMKTRYTIDLVALYWAAAKGRIR
jgi:hypothetical protein